MKTFVIGAFILGCIHLFFVYLKKKMTKKRNIENPIDLAKECQEMKDVNFQEEKIEISSSKRNIASWKPKNHVIRGLVFIAHGFAEHALSYSHLAERLVSEGFAVHAIDHIGHGLSDGKRGIIPDYQVLYKDFVAFVEIVRKQYSTHLPTFLFCHSMGGLVGIMSVNKLENITAVVFSSAALVSGPGAASPFGLRVLYPLSKTHSAGFLSQMMASIDPEGPASPVLPEDITTNLEEIDRMLRDPRRNEGFLPNKSAAELIRWTKVAKQEVSRISIPFLAIHGSDDEVIYKEASEYIYSASATSKEKKQLKIIAGAKHECIHEIEPIKSNTINLIASFLKSFV